MTAPSAAAGGAERPRDGGVLRLYGPGDIDHLDPVAASPGARAVLRLLSRQLLSYQPHADLRNWQSVAPVPDVAVAVPSTYNAGLGASHRSYVLHLRPQVCWDTSPPREVTAQDFVRGFKRVAGTPARSAARTYFSSVIRGMAQFCDGFAAAVPPTAPAEQYAAYQNAHEIPGLFVLDDQTLVIELLRASPDFTHMLALFGASAAPVEYDALAPGSPESHRNLRSNGPYRVAHHLPGKELLLEPNPAWLPESDPVRERHLDAIEITVEAASPREIAGRIEAGHADLAWGVPVRSVPADRHADPAGTLSWDLDPYLVFNVAGGAAALGDVRVRRAIAAGIDKAAVLELCRRRHDGAEVEIAASVVPPNNDAHQDLPVDARAAHGQPELARALLDEAGYPAGLALTAVYELGEPEQDVLAVCAAALARAGVELRLVGLERPDYHQLRHQRHPEPATGWDLMLSSASADWHYRNGRVFLQSLFETGAAGNLGGFSDPEVDESIQRALAAATEAPATALAAWHEVQRRVLERAAVVPVLFRAPVVGSLRGARVRNALPVPALGYGYDLSALWLDNDRGEAPRWKDIDAHLAPVEGAS